MLSCPGCPVFSILSRARSQARLSRPTRLSYPSQVPCLWRSVLSILSSFFCPGLYYPDFSPLATLPWLSCPAMSALCCPVWPVLSWLSCYGCPNPVVLFHMSCLLSLFSFPGFTIPTVFSGCPDPTVLSRLSCPSRPLSAFLFSHPVPVVLSKLSFPSCPSQLSWPCCPFPYCPVQLCKNFSETFS